MQGEVVITKLNQEVLIDIAEEGDGVYIDGSNTDDAVAFIKEELNSQSTRINFSGSLGLVFCSFF